MAENDFMRRTWRLLAVVGALCASGGAPQVAASNGAVLTAEVIRALVPGSSGQISSSKTGTVGSDENYELVETLTFEAGGAVTGRSVKNSSFYAVAGDSSETYLTTNDSDRGQWSVAEDKLCIKWSKWWEGENRCYAMTMVGGALWARRPGAPAWRLRVDSAELARLTAKKPKKPARARAGAGKKAVADTLRPVLNLTSPRRFRVALGKEYRITGLVGDDRSPPRLTVNGRRAKLSRPGAGGRRIAAHTRAFDLKYTAGKPGARRFLLEACDAARNCVAKKVAVTIFVPKASSPPADEKSEQGEVSRPK